jgi:hypothetical protein
MDSNKKRKRSEDEERKRDGGADTSGDSPALAVAEDDDDSSTRSRSAASSSENKAQPGEARRVSSSNTSNNDRSTAKNQQCIRVPKYKDILLGRGRGIQSSNGNFLMREITKKHRGRYCSLPRADRRAYSEKVADEILATGARFLRRVDNGDTLGMELWEEVQDRSTMHDKVSHSLREKQSAAATRDEEIEAVTAGNSNANPFAVAQHQAFLRGQQVQGQHTLGGGGAPPPVLFMMGSEAGGVHQVAPPLMGGAMPSHPNAMMTQAAMLPGAGSGVYQQYGNNILSSILSSSGAAGGAGGGAAAMSPQVQAGLFQIMAGLHNHGAPPMGTSNLQSPSLVNGLLQQYGTTMGNPSAAAVGGGAAAQQHQPNVANSIYSTFPGAGAHPPGSDVGGGGMPSFLPQQQSPLNSTAAATSANNSNNGALAAGVAMSNLFQQQQQQQHYGRLQHPHTMSGVPQTTSAPPPMGLAPGMMMFPQQQGGMMMLPPNANQQAPPPNNNNNAALVQALLAYTGLPHANNFTPAPDSNDQKSDDHHDPPPPGGGEEADNQQSP